MEIQTALSLKPLKIRSMLIGTFFSQSLIVLPPKMLVFPPKSPSVLLLLLLLHISLSMMIMNTTYIYIIYLHITTSFLRKNSKLQHSDYL